MKELLEELYVLYEKNVNAPTREKTLTAISAHPKGNVLAQLVLERADAAVFLSAKNQLLPKREGDEYGPFDFLLEAPACKRILRAMARENYVIDLLKDEFKRRYKNEPQSLSDIVRILADLEKINEESLVPKASFHHQPKPGQYIKLGSDWIVSDSIIYGENVCNHPVGTRAWFESQLAILDDAACINVYKILRSNGITLKQLEFLYVSHNFIFLEPFLIADLCDSANFRVFNLLEPSEFADRSTTSAMKISKEADGKEARGFSFLWCPSYRTDNRVNGKYRESVLFPAIWKDPSQSSIFIECIRFGRSSMKAVWKKELYVPYGISEDSEHLSLLDPNNYVLMIKEKEGHLIHIWHIILSKQKVVHYAQQTPVERVSFFMFGERLGMKFKVDNGSYDIIGAFTGEENESIEVICFLYDDGEHSIGTWYDGIQWRNEMTLTNWAISFQDIKKFINDENEKKIYTTKNIDGIVVKKPIIHSGLSSVEKATFWVDSRSKIGRVMGEKIEIFI